MKDNRSFFEKITGSVVSNENPPKEPQVVAAGSVLMVKDDAAKEATKPDEHSEEIDDNEGQLTVDVYQTPTHIVVQAPMAGVNPDDVDVSINNDMITIRGKREAKRETRGSDYYYREVFWGSVSRSVLLPEEVDSDKAEASFKHGLLTIKLPKTNKDAGAHRVSVKTREE